MDATLPDPPDNVRPSPGLLPLQLALAALGIALGAQVEMAVPGSPVPVSLQTMMVVVAGVSLGPRLGAAAVALYIAAGAAGLPVFADGRSGLTVLTGATGGYLLGFVVGAAVAGQMAPEASRPPMMRLLAAATVGQLAVLGLGVPWLALATGRTASAALEVGCWPFLPGLVLKSALVVAAIWLWRRLTGLRSERVSE